MKFRLFIMIFLVFSIVFLRIFLSQKKENTALRIKIISLSKIKKTPVPWSYLPQAPLKQVSINNKVLLLKSNPEENIKISELPIALLTSELNKNIQDIKSIDLKTADRNIELANEIILRTPDTYSAYKAKLMMILLKENKFNQKIDEYELNNLLFDLAAFKSFDSGLNKNESNLFVSSSEANQTIKDEVENQLSALSKNNEESLGLVQSEQSNASLVATNDDVVEVPFLRLLAKKDYDTAINNAQSFIDEFPNSITGYYYLFKAFELNGQEDAAENILTDPRLSPDLFKALKFKLESTDGEAPERYWEKLIF